ncbi:MAG: class II aldolase/adducin family protein [Limnochordales bacterium]|nr:class II aldolase/adducin family protein [Limnochordales bacterium]
MASDAMQRFAAGLREVMLRHGHSFVPQPTDDIQLVFNFTDARRPRPFRRRAKATFVISVTEASDRQEVDVAKSWAPGAGGAGPDILKQAYPILIRAVSNLLLYRVWEPGGSCWQTYFVTLEQGAFPVPAELQEGTEEFFEYVYRRIEPLATSQLIIDNEFIPDLEPELWEGDEHTEEIYWAGQRLAAMDLLPAPFPIQELLSPTEYRHVQHLYNLGGLSYGNMSVRHDEKRFWMSASGVDKSNMRKVGEEILMVKDFDSARGVILLSVPPLVEKPRRVSVDAIEHWMIYHEHPSVGAILHIHAWIPGIEATEFNFPCGTRQLAMAVAEKVRQAPDPSRAIVGLKNHGMTITGHSLREIFERIEGKVVRQVPMS